MHESIIIHRYVIILGVHKLRFLALWLKNWVYSTIKCTINVWCVARFYTHRCRWFLKRTNNVFGFVEINFFY